MSAIFWNVKYRQDEHETWGGTPYRFTTKEAAEAKAQEYRADGFEAIVVTEDEWRERR